MQRKGLSSVLAEGIGEYCQMRAQGVSQADAMRGLEAILRDLWPPIREWNYYCDHCGDVGLTFQWRMVEKVQAEYEVAEPCHCRAGLRWLEAGRKRQQRAEDELAQVGQVRRGKFSRVGR